MCNETKKTETAEAHDSRNDPTIPDCCGPMVERMLEAFRSTEEDAVNGGSARDSGADRFRSCRSMIERMASRCCGPTDRP